MQAVAADLLEVRDPLQPAADRRHARLVVGVVDRIGLRHAHDVTALDAPGGREADRLELARGLRDELGVARRPQVVALEAEVLHPDAGRAGSGTIAALQARKFWIRPTRTPGSWT